MVTALLIPSPQDVCFYFLLKLSYKDDVLKTNFLCLIVGLGSSCIYVSFSGVVRVLFFCFSFHQ